MPKWCAKCCAKCCALAYNTITIQHDPLSMLLIPFCNIFIIREDLEG